MARFQPGQSGNPGGRPRGMGEARRIARQHAGHAVFALSLLCCDLRAEPRQRLAAAELLLRYGFGSHPAGPGPAGIGLERGARRWIGVRRRVLELIQTLDEDHDRIRRVILADLAAHELEEGQHG